MDLGFVLMTSEWMRGGKVRKEVYLMTDRLDD